MTARAKKINPRLVVSIVLLIFSSSNYLRVAAQGVTLYTPYTKISVPPGESINYDIEVINKGKSVCNAPIAVNGLPRNWTYSVKAGGWNVSQVSILPNDKKLFTLQLQVPLKVNKGAYHFTVSAIGQGVLPLTVVVSQQGVLKSELTSNQPNMQGAASSTFTYTATLRNGTDANQVYSLNAQAPQGWGIVFKADYKQVSSISIEANKTKDITIEVNPPAQIPAGHYKVPIVASTGTTSANLALDLQVTGSYSMELTTPTGVLSTKATAAEEKRIELQLKNTGTAEIKNVNLVSTAPSNWTVSFDPKTVDDLAPGAAAQVFAIIKCDKKAIPGDYMVSMEARTNETASKAAYRVSVETSLLSGWFGFLIIVLAVGGVYYLFRKYGRR